MKTELRLTLFFVANPDEELTFRDGELKFGVPWRSVYVAARSLAELGVVKLERPPRRESPGMGPPAMNIKAGPVLLEALGSR